MTKEQRIAIYMGALQQVDTFHQSELNTALIALNMRDEDKEYFTDISFPPIGKHKETGPDPKRCGQLSGKYIKYLLTSPNMRFIKEKYPEFWNYLKNVDEKYL